MELAGSKPVGSASSIFRLKLGVIQRKEAGKIQARLHFRHVLILDQHFLTELPYQPVALLLYRGVPYAGNTRLE
jgi:hypothetical protein